MASENPSRDESDTDAEPNSGPVDPSADTRAEPEEEPPSGPEPEGHADRVSTVRGVTLLDDEELLFDLRPAWYGDMSLGKALLYGAATLFTMGFALLVLWYPLLKMYRKSSKIRYVITSERIIIKDKGGMLGTAKTEEYPIRDVTDIQTRATWFERKNNLGTVTFREHDGAGSKIELTSVQDYEEIASTIGAYQRREDRKRRHYGDR